MSLQSHGSACLHGALHPDSSFPFVLFFWESPYWTGLVGFILSCEHSLLSLISTDVSHSSLSMGLPSQFGIQEAIGFVSSTSMTHRWVCHLLYVSINVYHTTCASTWLTLPANYRLLMANALVSYQPKLYNRAHGPGCHLHQCWLSNCYFLSSLKLLPLSHFCSLSLGFNGTDSFSAGAASISDATIGLVWVSSQLHFRTPTVLLWCYSSIAGWVCG